MATGPAPRRIALLRQNAGFRRLWAGRAVSYLGDGAGTVALVLHVQATERRGIAVGGLLLAAGLPRLLGPVAGAVVDRWPPRRLMIGCNLGLAAVYGVLGGVLPPYTVVIGLVGAASILDMAFEPAARSAIPRLVREPELTVANAWMGLALDLQVAVGPAAGGLLVAVGGVRGALLADAATFLVIVAMVARLPALPRAGGDRGRGVLAGTLEGVQFALRNPTLRALTFGLLAAITLVAMDNVALVFLVRGELGGGSLEYGLVSSAFGAGMIAAAVALIRVARSMRVRRLLLGSSALTTAGLVLTGLSPWAPLASAGQLTAGAGNGLDNVAIDTAVQRSVPAPLLGRAFAILGSAAMAGQGLAAGLGGVLVDATGARITFVVAGLGWAAAMLLVWHALPAD